MPTAIFFNYQAWDLDPSRRPGFTRVRQELSRIEEDIQNGIIEEEPPLMPTAGGGGGGTRVASPLASQ